MMDESKFCFILCTNNSKYEQECMFYINRLKIPIGYEIEILSIKDAPSMTAGYNAGMESSAAKYKIYLHQDVFILEEDFLVNILNLFQLNETIGMIGMVGCENLSPDGVLWHAKRVGSLYGMDYYDQNNSEMFAPVEKGFQFVEAVDGFLLATQYDIQWREDLFDKWDFYDISQCMEFKRAGYKIVIPEQEKPWCLHDCGLLSLDNYEEERLKFVEEYSNHEPI